MESTALNLLSQGTRRLPSRKRATSAKRSNRKIVTPAVEEPDLPAPVFGCNISEWKIEQGAYAEDIIEPTSYTDRMIMEDNTREQIRNLPTLIVDKLSYSIFSHDELKEQAVFDVTKTGDIGPNTVNDPRTGAVERGKLCVKCTQDNLSCPGHYGRIVLEKTIIHPMFHRVIIDILNSVCNSCGGLLLSEEQIRSKGYMKLSGSKRLRAIGEASKGIPCRRKQPAEATVSSCTPNPIYIPSKGADIGEIFYQVDKDSPENTKTIEEIFDILSAISPEDSEIIGFATDSSPSRFIIRSIPVIPLCSRPPVYREGQVHQDHITEFYKDIVKFNLDLKNINTLLIDDKTVKTETELKDMEANRNRLEKKLFEAISHLINNSDQSYKHGSQVFQDIKTRINSKEGLLRNAMMAKRVNFSGRTVLSGDPTIKFNQIRVPEIWAPFLTQVETVSSANVGRLTELLRSGRITHLIPGRGPEAGRKKKVSEKLQRQQLSHGDKVWRWLQNGDYVVFNRQPTLHKQGFMGYEVVLGKQLTIGLHLAATTPHNADFDGDEGNVHAAQSLEAVQEIKHIMAASKCIMNAQTNKNIMGVIFDALLGVYLLTQPETEVDRGTFNDIVLFLENSESLPTLNERLDKYNVPRMSGRALFSAMLPVDFYYQKGDVLILEGILVKGVITKDHVGNTHGSIIQVMIKDYGEKTAVDFLSDIYKSMIDWITRRGFSVGIGDCYLSGKDSDTAIKTEIEKAKLLVRSMGKKLDDPIEEARREKQIIAYLDTAKQFGNKLTKDYLSTTNAFYMMAASGAKGGAFNTAQITGILGQQFLEGQRMPETISGGRRCLPYFPEDSLDPEARGFCTNSYMSGLSPSEFWFQAVSGRKGLVDTAVTTQTTGHLHRQMVKAMEDIKVVRDGSVRNAADDIYQFTYGDDGFDAAMLESVSTKSGSFTSFLNIKRAVGKINARYGFAPEYESDLSEVQKEVPENVSVDAEVSQVTEYETTGQFNSVTVGDNVETAMGQGIIREIQGERLLVDINGQQTWIKMGKIE